MTQSNKTTQEIYRLGELVAENQATPLEALSWLDATSGDNEINQQAREIIRTALTPPSTKESGTAFAMIDWDDCASLAPSAFVQFAKNLHENGVPSMVCTSRSADDSTNGEIFKHFEPEQVIFCEGETKKTAIERLGYTALFWVDDTPEAIIDKHHIDLYFENDS